MAALMSCGNAAEDSVALFNSAARGRSTVSAKSRASARILVVSSGSRRSSASASVVRGRFSRDDLTVVAGTGLLAEGAWWVCAIESPWSTGVKTPVECFGVPIGISRCEVRWGSALLNKGEIRVSK